MKIKIGKHFCKVSGECSDGYSVELTLRGIALERGGDISSTPTDLVLKAIETMKPYSLLEKEITDVDFKSEPDFPASRESIKIAVNNYNQSIKSR